MNVKEQAEVYSGFVYIATSDSTESTRVKIDYALESLEKRGRGKDNFMAVIAITSPDQLRPRTSPLTPDDTRKQVAALATIFTKLGYARDDGTLKVRAIAKAFGFSPAKASELVNGKRAVSLDLICTLGQAWIVAGRGPMQSEAAFAKLLAIRW